MARENVDAKPAAGDLGVCEQWCGRQEGPDGCSCIGKLRALLADLDAVPQETPEAAARMDAAKARLRHMLNGSYDPRTDGSGRLRLHPAK